MKDRYTVDFELLSIAVKISFVSIRMFLSNSVGESRETKKID